MRPADRLAAYCNTLERIAVPANFVVHADKSGSYRWKLVSTNGQTIATFGESSSKASARKAAENVKKRATDASVVVED
jgi:uncharacterized protein YegP (UPF0339 family)